MLSKSGMVFHKVQMKLDSFWHASLPRGVAPVLAKALMNM